MNAPHASTAKSAAAWKGPYRPEHVIKVRAIEDVITRPMQITLEAIAQRARPSRSFFMHQAILTAAADFMPWTLRTMGLPRTVAAIMEVAPKSFPKAVLRQYRNATAPYRRSA